jgi:hypothetical protein
MAPKARAWPSRALEGEDLETPHWEDARHSMSVYAGLLEFKRGILDRVRRDMTGLRPLARYAAAADVQIIEDQMQGYQARLDLWSRRIWELHGLWLDPGRPNDPVSGPGTRSHRESSSSYSSYSTIPTATPLPRS